MRANTIHMFKGIINAFDYKEICLVMHLTITGWRAGVRSLVLASIYIRFSTKFYTWLKDLLPCLQYKNYLGKYFIQYVQNGFIIHLTNALKNNICQN